MPVEMEIERAGFLLACLACILCFTTACTPEPPGRSPTANEIAAAFNTKPPATALEDPLPALNFYVDSSMSMMGYAAVPGSRYSTTVLTLWHKVTTARYPVRGFQFAQGFARLGSKAEVQLISPAFYSGAETHLTELFKRVAEHIKNGEISIIVSDMVESAQDLKQMDLVREMSQLLSDRRPEVLLLAFRSGFNGPYYVSMGAGGSYPLRLEDAPGQGRPFYVLIFAPDQPALETLRKYALTGLGEEASFQPTLPPLAVSKESFAAARTPPVIWSRFRAPEPIATKISASALVERLVESDPPQATGSAIEIRFTAEPRVPVRDPAKFHVGVEKAVFKAGRRNPSSVPVPEVKAIITPSGRTDGAGFTVSLARLPRPAADSWEVYRVQIRAGAGNLDTPLWVRNWSTPNDQSAKAANRTLYLDVLIESMVRAITENVVFSDHFIALGRGK